MRPWTGQPEPVSAGNDAQIEFWNGAGGETWVRAQARLDAMLAPISDAVLDHAGRLDGLRVLDVGCGCGATSLDAVARGAAHVQGLDISAPMLALARSRAGDDGRLDFTVADAAVTEFDADYDLILSRFGVMFFADPSAAFANLRGALSDSGRLCFVCWQAPRVNPWVSVAGAAVQPFLPSSAAPQDPKAPGPFAFADPAYVEGVLAGAGFSEVALTAFETPLHLGDDLDEALDFQGEVGPMARVLAELDGEARIQAIAAARAALEPHLGPDGLHLGAACWLVSAGR